MKKKHICLVVRWRLYRLHAQDLFCSIIHFRPFVNLNYDGYFISLKYKLAKIFRFARISRRFVRIICRLLQLLCTPITCYKRAVTELFSFNFIPYSSTIIQCFWNNQIYNWRTHKMEDYSKWSIFFWKKNPTFCYATDLLAFTASDSFCSSCNSVVEYVQSDWNAENWVHFQFES